MNQEITLADYNSIGTMETALSEHADEAFFELSEDKQKIAEKIFKCLTETDRENREIRRATTVGKLCAIADADFSEVAAVIEVFRKEGRTFLMPPPGVELNENSLIDISHESLIRKWERLKTWVEEEGQSSRTYRRLAEDALLHQQGKMGFWSDPELKDALEWRENFKPNETWAQLYKETGERQFRAAFADAMRYLDESEINHNEEIAEDRRQQETLRKSARNLRWMLAGLGVFSILTIGAAIFAFYQMNKSIQATNALEAEKTTKDKLNLRLMDEVNFSEAARKDKDKAFDELNVKTKELESKKEELSDSLDKQEEATKRADKEAQQAKLSEAEKEKALEVQKRLSKEAEDAKNDAIEKQGIAEKAKTRAELMAERERSNRVGLLYLDRGENSRALEEFVGLFDSYKKDSELDKSSKAEGEWWALHNLGNVYSKTEQFEQAEYFYLDALKTLDSFSAPTSKLQNSENVYFQPVFYKTDTGFALNRTATLRKLALLYSAAAYNASGDARWQELLVKAVERYNQLLKILENEKLSSPPAEVYVELADCLAALNDYGKAEEFYAKAIKIYENEGNLVKQVDALKRWGDAAIARKDGDTAVKQLKKAIDIQEKKMNLSPVNLEIADSYDQFAKADELSVQGDGYISPPYDELFGLIRKLDYAANKTDYIDERDVVKLADTYIAIAKCHRAEKVYLYALDRSKQSSQQGKYLRDYYVYLHFTVGLADLYQNVLHDDVNAQKYYDEFYETLLKRNAESYRIDENLYIKSGDYYFTKGDYARAGKIYEAALRQIENSDEKFDIANAIDANEKVRIIDLINAKSELIVRIARIFDKQNKPQEAEAEYLKAFKFVSATIGETNVLAAKALIYQADFYESRKDVEKAKENYTKAQNILKNPAILIEDKTQKYSASSAAAIGLEVRILKKLGDINRNNVKTAVDFYRQANTLLDEYSNQAGMFQSNSSQYDSRYFFRGTFTAQYYLDKAEVLEAWLSLNGVEGNEDLKAELETTRSISEDLKNFACEEDEQ